MTTNENHAEAILRKFKNNDAYCEVASNEAIIDGWSDRLTPEEVEYLKELWRDDD